MQVSPKVASIITGTLTVAGVIAALSPSMFPSYIPDGVVKDILQTAGLVSAVGMGLATSLHLFSAPTPGPLAPPLPPVVVAAQKVADLPPTASPVQVEAAKASATFAIKDHQP